MRYALLSVALLLACGTQEPEDPEVGDATTEGAGSSSDGGVLSTMGGNPTTAGSATSTTSAGMTTTPPPTTGEDDTGSDDGGGGMFVQRPDGGAANECDPREQDCPRGEKCTAWANDGGGFWNANRCVPVTGQGVAGDPCMVEGSGVSGNDDCGVGNVCMYTNEENMGTCIQFCQGDDDDCAPGDVCAVYNDGVLPICLVACDPLANNCPEGQSCIDTPNQRFICFTDASGEAGADGDPCPPSDGENSCDPGMWCGPGSADCVDVNCCTPYCDTTGDDCTGADECVSFFGMDNAPPGLENVGVCVLP